MEVTKNQQLKIEQLIEEKRERCTQIMARRSCGLLRKSIISQCGFETIHRFVEVLAEAMMTVEALYMKTPVNVVGRGKLENLENVHVENLAKKIESLDMKIHLDLEERKILLDMINEWMGEWQDFQEQRTELLDIKEIVLLKLVDGKNSGK